MNYDKKMNELTIAKVSAEYEFGYTPNNLKKLLNEYGFDREYLADLFDINIRQVHRWCVEPSNKNHQSMSHRRWMKLLGAIDDEMSKR